MSSQESRFAVRDVALPVKTERTQLDELTHTVDTVET